MWIKPILAAVTALGVASGVSAANDVSRPFVSHPTQIANLAMTLAEDGGAEIPANVSQELLAAVLALLLVSEIGVAEGYEEVVEGGDDDDGDNIAEADGEDAYSEAYDLLQTVHRLIALVPAARESADVIELLGRLDALMPSEEQPEALDADPEAGEVIAQALVGVLERETGAELYLGRDLRTALETISHMVAHACNARGFDHEAEALITAGVFYFEETLEATLSVMMPDTAEVIEEAFEAMSEDGPSNLEACFDLTLAFDDAARLFGGRG